MTLPALHSGGGTAGVSPILTRFGNLLLEVMFKNIGLPLMCTVVYVYNKQVVAGWGFGMLSLEIIFIIMCVEYFRFSRIS